MTAHARTVLLVDDEPTLVATVKYNLERDGFQVLTAGDGEAAMYLHGLEVCRLLRNESSLPILMLTAKTEEVDRVVGLEMGADDYLTKPFGMRELVARVRALLRRTDSTPEVESLVFGDLIIDLRRHQAFRDSTALELKPKELELLIFLAHYKGRAFTRGHLLRDVWGYDFFGDSRTVDVHVRWLRQKIEVEPAKPVRLVTVRGAGYRFEG